LSLQKCDANFVSTQAMRLAKRIGAVAYFETSVLQRKGLDELFSYVAECTIIQPVAKKGISFRGFWSKK
jgi:hypothetical protein